MLSDKTDEKKIAVSVPRRRVLEDRNRDYTSIAALVLVTSDSPAQRNKLAANLV